MTTGLALVALFMLSAEGCGAKRIPYEPSRDVSREQAVAVVTRFLEEQPSGYVPASVEIGADKIAITQDVVRRGLFARVSTSQVATLYWDNFGRSELLDSRDWFVVDIYDRDGQLFLRAFSLNEQKARRFIDAFESLKQSPPDLSPAR